ncbi:hypothetical protein [Shimia aestuarii]|uniref:Uncharacterized protein n=1 Tax=Shimia aestuarii TaxID=254406 RepID=A0A1I4IN09_9RHOB|nr:hypothetical protein [Shimia aestuarii]SFL55447.1 hypothetical protein SAMN04488042_101662 [Shimia aestuarii]
MSDPVTNSEIEDVLTSIRRLVSENRKPAQAAAPVAVSHGENEAKQLESEHPPAPPALVLTPSLRVAEVPQEAEADGDDDVAPEDESFAAWDDVDDGEEAAAEAAAEEDIAADIDEDAEDAVAAWEEDASELSEGDGDDRHDDELDAGSDVSEAEAMANSDAWDAPEAAPDVPEAGDADAWHDTFEDAGEDRDVDVAEDHVEAGQDSEMPGEEETPFDFQQVLDARIVQWREGEPAFGPEEPDAPGDSDYAGTETVATGWSAEPHEEDVETTTLEQALQDEFIEEVEAAALPDLADGVDEAAVIDEEMLREMVADIVRQELQGALGERITRNVRKLVRREIHRALAAHDLD